MAKSQSRLQLARSALQLVEGDQGVRSYAHRSLQEESLKAGVYEVREEIPALLTALTTLFTDESWVALAGIDNIGWEAAQAAGIDLCRVVEVDSTSGQIAPVLATLVEGFDVMIVGAIKLSLPQQRTLAARARTLNRIILTTSNWPLSSSLFPGLEAQATRWTGVR